MLRTTLAVTTLVALFACAPAPNSGSGAGPATPPAPAPTDLSGFAGARAGQAENGLRSRGYALARTEGLTAFWFNAAANDCARIVTADGRYQSVEKVPASLCGAGGTAASTPSPAEQACLRDVSRTTSNPDVVVLRSSFSEAGTQVIVGVGPQRARWNCIAYANGTTAGIQSLTDEGSL